MAPGSLGLAGMVGSVTAVAVMEVPGKAGALEVKPWTWPSLPR